MQFTPSQLINVLASEVNTCNTKAKKQKAHTLKALCNALTAVNPSLVFDVRQTRSNNSLNCGDIFECVLKSLLMNFEHNEIVSVTGSGKSDIARPLASAIHKYGLSRHRFEVKLASAYALPSDNPVRTAYVLKGIVNSNDTISLFLVERDNYTRSLLDDNGIELEELESVLNA